MSDIKLSLVQQADNSLKAELFRLSMPAWSWSIDTGKVQCNSEFERFFESSVTTLSDFLPLISDDGGERFLSLAGRAIQDRIPFFTEVTLSTAKGQQQGFLWGSSEPDGPKSNLKVVGVIHSSDNPGDFHRAFAQHHKAVNPEMQTLLDSIRSPIWYLDCEGRIIQGNQEAEKIVSSQHSIGCLFSEVLPHLDDPARRQTEIQQVIESGIALFDSLESFSHKGHEHWYRVDKVPTKDSEGQVTGVMLTFKDVTTDVLTKKALEESETRYRAFISNSSEAVFRIDLMPHVSISQPFSRQIQQIQSSGILVESNMVMAEMFGY